MSQANLLGQPYNGKALIASGQEAINVYAESNQDAVNAPAPITYYQFPGNELFGTPIEPLRSRCTYRTSIGTLYCVVGTFVYFVTSNGVMSFIGSIPDRLSQVVMADNGLALVLVDGTEGWAIEMSSNSFGQIIDASFYGADFALFLDTFFVFNRPGTNQFYISGSMVTYAMLTGGTAFDPLDIAAKSGSADPIVGMYTTHKELGLVGELTTENWIGTGAADFYFQLIQGAYIDHGCGAKYSIASQDVLTFWIAQDKQGKNLILQAQGQDIKEISTPYLVAKLNSYETVADAIGSCFQIGGHAFYYLAFPTAGECWLYSLKIGYWFKIAKWIPADNSFARFRANNFAFAFGYNLLGDYSTGKLFKLNIDLAVDGYGDTEDGEDVSEDMKFVRTFQHMLGPNYERVVYKSCSLKMTVGNSTQVLETDEAPQIFLDWSDDGGKTFGFPVPQSLGKQGEYLTDPQWNKLGMGRDRIFRATWNGPTANIALNAAYVEPVLLRS